MQQGLQTFDENGIVVYDSNTRLSRVCGIITGGTAQNAISGYVDIPAEYYTNNTPFFIVTGMNLATTYAGTDRNKLPPKITLSGSRITYENLRCDIIYGVF